MKYVGLLALLMLAGCHKTVPIAAKAPPPAPVTEAPAPAPVSPPARVAAAPAPAPQPRPQAPAQMTAEERATLNSLLAKLEDALFDYDRATIRNDATAALHDDVNVIRGILANYPAQKLLIVGSADERGSAEYNLALGDKRARAAEEFLGAMGIPQTQLTIISYGKEHPVCTEQSEECWQKNRRAHITAAP